MSKKSSVKNCITGHTRNKTISPFKDNGNQYTVLNVQFIDQEPVCTSQKQTF